MELIKLRDKDINEFKKLVPIRYKNRLKELMK